MKAKLLNDSSREQGWACLELIFDDTDSQRPVEGENFTLAVRRLPEQIFLQEPGGERWPQGGAEHYLKPDDQSWDGHGHTLVLNLGPDFTAALAHVPCVFTLKGSQAAVFDTPIRVNTSTLKAPATNHKIVIDPDAERRRREEEEKAREAAALKEAEELLPVEESAPAPPAQQPEKQESPQEPKTDPVEPEKPKENEKKKLLKFTNLVIIIILIAVLALAAWLRAELIRPDTNEELPSTGRQELDEPIQPSDETLGTPSLDPKAEVAELFRRNAPYAELEEAFNKLDGQAGAEDSVFLLLTELAPTKPMFRTRLGTFFDPSDPRPSGTINKDPLAAYTEYQAAQDAGDSEAATFKARLLQWAKENAATDPAATELLNR